MEEKVNRWPIIAVIAASALGLATFSVMQSTQRKAQQEKEAAKLLRKQEETTTAMQKIGRDAAKAQGQLELSKAEAWEHSAAAAELKRLETEDRAATALPRSNTPR